MVDSLKENIKANFTTEEIAKLRYLYLVLIYETSKFIFMFIFFAYFQRYKEYCICILVLLSVRNFFGGLHFQSYISCFFFTFFFVSSGLVLSKTVVLPAEYQELILLLAILFCHKIGPITSSNRPELSEKQRKVYGTCGIIVLTGYLILFITLRTFPGRNICFWVIVLQTLQLIAAKFYRKGDHKT